MRERGTTRRRMLGIGGALGLMAATGLSTAAALARRPSITGAELRSTVPLGSVAKVDRHGAEVLVGRLQWGPVVMQKFPTKQL
jgi:hypothetical protein